MRHKLRTAISLSRREWKWFFQAWFVLLFVDLGLRLLSFPRLQSWLKVRGDCSPKSPGETGSMITLAQAAVDRAIRNHLYPMTCLRRALTLQYMLARQGITVALRFGVQRQTEGITAHAWLEYNDQPIGESREIEKRYAQLAFQEQAR
jgi:hypothetical protein